MTSSTPHGQLSSPCLLWTKNFHEGDFIRTMDASGKEQKEEHLDLRGPGTQDLIQLSSSILTLVFLSHDCGLKENAVSPSRSAGTPRL